MIAEPLVIVGAGGFGRKVADIVDRVNSAQATRQWHMIGFVDDAPSDLNLERLAKRRLPYLGTVNEFMENPQKVHYILGIGSPQVRELMANRFDIEGHLAATLVDPMAMIGTEVEVGEGSVICSGAALDTNTKYGRHVQAGFNVIVGHDAKVGDFTSLSPLCAISGDCEVGDRVLIGVAATVMLGRRVGNDVIVGSNGTVARDVPDGATVKGVPAR